MANYIVWIVLAVIVVGAVLNQQLKQKKNTALAANGQDKERLRQLIGQLLPQESDLQVVYAHHEDVQHYGRTTRTTYYHYALAFAGEKMWIVPLGFEKGDIRPGQPVLYTSQSLGVVDVTPTLKKGVLSYMDIQLRDKEGENPVRLTVDVTNLSSDRFHHFNLIQEEECGELQRFLESFSATVASENEGLSELLENKALQQSSKGAITLGVLGILLSWTVVIGLIFGVIGLLSAPSPSKTGGKAKAPYILCLVATILSVLFLIAFIVIVKFF